jgi:hypothetical protein
MGKSEALTASEEAGSSAAAGAAETAVEDAGATVPTVAGQAATAHVGTAAGPVDDAEPNPWQALIQAGAQFVAAFAAVDNPAASPLIERDPATGARHLKVPLPAPATVRQLADAFSAIAEGLRKAAM